MKLHIILSVCLLKTPVGRYFVIEFKIKYMFLHFFVFYGACYTKQIVHIFFLSSLHLFFYILYMLHNLGWYFKKLTEQWHFLWIVPIKLQITLFSFILCYKINLKVFLKFKSVNGNSPKKSNTFETSVH